MPPFDHRQDVKDILNATLHNVRDSPDPLIASRSLARGTTIIGLMLEGLGDKYRSKRLGSVVFRVGSVLWGIVELAAPRSLGQILFQYWIVVLFALALLMLLVGLAAKNQPVATAGMAVFALAILLAIVVEKLRFWMARGSARSLRVLLWVLPLILGLGGASWSMHHLQGIEARMIAQGAPQFNLGLRAGALQKYDDLKPVLGVANTEQNRKLMLRSLEWDYLLIASYILLLLSLGWLVATHFDRPGRAFALIAISALAGAGFDIAENVQAQLILNNFRGFSPVYTSELKLWAIAIAFAILLLQALAAFRQSRYPG